MRGRVCTGAASAAVALVAFIGRPAFERAAFAQDQTGASAVPVFEVDSHFPAMPDRMLLGGVGGATADSHGNVWVFHRPHTLEEGNATLNGYVPPPPGRQFSATGRCIRGWRGPTRSAQYDSLYLGGQCSAACERPR